ncbi:DUF6531 domain-containing protein [Streptomyces sp. NPDC006875]|uniref:DUF6531 domain-containing protein n=1 Tax=Streptomyces sp. NPDC006875 TaxID=3154781 RepID=UPI0033E8CA17
MSVEDEAKKILLKLGLWWPDANSGSLRSAATAWRTFADAVDDVRGPVHTSASSLIHHNTGESIDAFEKFWGRYARGKDAGWLSDLAESARAMAKALDKFADAIDDAINKLWTQIGVDAAVIAGGVALAFFTAGLASGAAVAAADAIIEFGTTMGVAVSGTVAEIAAGTLIAASFGGIESVTVDLAVAQPLKMVTGLQQGFNLDEVNQAAKDGVIFGGALGAGTGVLKAGVEGAFSDTTPLLLRPPSLRPDLVDLGPAARSADRTPCVGEPIDVATGAMLMTQTDLTLPASLPLLFQRTHLSSYRGGVCFGPTWTSTLDECVQIDGEGVVFAAADGMRLVYPVPEPDVPTLPVRGARWPLRWDGKPDGVMTITDPGSGVVRTFSTPFPSGSFGVVHLPLDSWSDRNGARIDIERDVEGVPFGIRHSGGYYLAVDSSGPRITALRLLDQPPSRFGPDGPMGEGTLVMRYGYDPAGNLTEVTDSSGEPLRFSYDDQGRMTRWTDRSGTWFCYVYDERGRVVRTEGVDGILSGTLTYDDTASTTTYTDSLGHASRHRYNAEGLVVEETDALGYVTRTEWEERGAGPRSVTDPLGRTTRYDYDSAGNLIELTLPDGSVASATYTTSSLPADVVEPGGAEWRHTYDSRGNLLAVIDPIGAETRYTYDESGHLATLTDPLGHTRAVTSDSAGLPVTVTDEIGHVTTIRRDAFGRIVELTDPLGRTTRLSWTVEGRPEWRELPDGSRESWTWDAEGNLLTHSDLAGNVTHHTVAPFDIPATRTAPDGTTYTFTHDTELRLTGVTDPRGRTWSYVYDPAGHLIAETDFDGRQLAYEQDASGALVARRNGAGESLRFARDQLGRVTEQRDDSGATTVYTYAASGRLAGARNAGSEVAFVYDAAGRTIGETVNGRTTSFVHDALGRTIRRHTPSGRTSHWTYDPLGRPVVFQSDVGQMTFEYDAAGRETRRLLGDHVELSQNWDPAGRLTSQTLTDTGDGTGNRLLQHRSYAYRPDGHLTQIRELTSGTRSFELDAIGRVTRVRALGWSETYAYDTTGNLTHTNAPAHEATGERTFDGTRIRSAGRTTYQHDAQGRLVRRTRVLLSGQRRTWTYAWDAEDRLTEVVTPDAERWQYLYDPLGRRIAKTRLAGDRTVTARTDFSWDGTRLAEQTSPDGRVTSWDYFPDTPRPVAQTDRTPMPRGSQESFLARLAEETTGDRDVRFHAIVTDAVGAPAELVTEEGEVTWQRRTALWGTGLPAFENAEETSTDCPLRFPGQFADAETGLHYNYFRYYDPETARYLSPDPLGLAPAPHPATYVHNPYSWSDPLGLGPCPQLRDGYGSQPAFRDDPYHPKVVDDRIRDMRDLYGIRDPRSAGMIGSNGPQITSKTLWNQGPYRIDVENPNPGQRPGQLHFQDQTNKSAKYQYNFETGEFDGIPRSLLKAVGNNPGFIAAIRKGLAALGEG